MGEGGVGMRETRDGDEGDRDTARCGQGKAWGGREGGKEGGGREGRKEGGWREGRRGERGKEGGGREGQTDR